MTVLHTVSNLKLIVGTGHCSLFVSLQGKNEIELQKKRIKVHYYNMFKIIDTWLAIELPMELHFTVLAQYSQKVVHAYRCSLYIARKVRLVLWFILYSVSMYWAGLFHWHSSFQKVRLSETVAAAADYIFFGMDSLNILLTIQSLINKTFKLLEGPCWCCDVATKENNVFLKKIESPPSFEGS